MLLRDVPVDAVGIPWEEWMEHSSGSVFLLRHVRNGWPLPVCPALAQSPMVEEARQLSPVPAVQAALPMIMWCVLKKKTTTKCIYKPNRVQARNENRPE